MFGFSLRRGGCERDDRSCVRPDLVENVEDILGRLNQDAFDVEPIG
jgi:hypothetical protein